ncbi:MAG: serine/threonine protein kinase [Planctomycetaceae bacterium]
MSTEQVTLDGFQLVNCVAGGNDTQIWEVAEGGSGRALAMKLLLPEAFADREKIQTLKREAKAGKLFEHPNVMKTHDVVVTKHHAYLIMDYFRSSNLKSLIHNDMLAIHQRMKRLVEQVCLGLGYIHDRGWLHRDVKPDNILFNRGSELKIVDFSLSVRSKKYKDKEIQGTKSYIAPETLLRQKQTRQTDMYSLGVTLYLALTGEFPITGMTPTELLKNHLRVVPALPSTLNPNVSPEMDDFVMRLLAKQPAKRFQTMDEAYSVIRSINVFKEDVGEVETRRKAKEEQILKDGVDAARRLDSRSDAKRSELTGNTPARPRPTPRRPVTPAAKSPQQVPDPPQPQPVAQMPPGAYPMPMPAAYPPMLPPQPPPMPTPPPQFYPGMPAPLQPGGVAPVMPVPQQVAAPQQAAPQPPTGQPAAPQSPPPVEKPPQSDDDLPFMEELPDVL